MIMIEQSLAWLEKAYGLKWIALRYFNAAGAALDGSLGEDHIPETHLIPLILKTALGQREAINFFGTDYSTPDGTCLRDYIHVLDLAKAHILSLEGLDAGMESGVYNVGTGSGYSVKEVIETARTVTGKTIPVLESPRRPGDPDKLVAKVEKLQTLLGWTPNHSSLEQIIESAWAWHLKHPIIRLLRESMLNKANKGFQRFRKNAGSLKFREARERFCCFLFQCIKMELEI